MSKHQLRVGMKLVLNAHWYWVRCKRCDVISGHNPLAEFIELPDNLSRSLWYSNILCGVMRGSFEMVIVIITAFISGQLAC